MLRKALLALVCLVPGTANAAWHEASSRHFVVYSDDTPEKVRAFTERLERFDKAIRVFHVTPDVDRGPTSRVTIYVLDSVADIQKLAGRRNVAGFYDPRAGNSVAFTPRKSGQGGDYGLTSQAVLMHEYGHHFMLTTWADASFPSWFVEGFAEFHATAIFRDDGAVTFGAVPTYRQYSVGNYNVLPIETMLDPGNRKLSDDQTGALYGRGWLLTHYLTFDPTRLGQFAAYIGAINSGKSTAEADKLLGNVSGLDFKLNAYGKRPALPSATLTRDQLPIGEVKVRALTPAEAAIMPARIRSDRGVTKEMAPAVVELARKLAAPFPNDAAAQNELAEAEYDAGNFAASEAASDRVLAADPKSIHGLVYKGMAQAAQAEKDKVTDPAKWQPIRRWFLAANKLDPENPVPLMRFYESYGTAKQTPTKNSENGYLYAYALAPYDASVRLTAGKILLEQGFPDKARVALGPVAYNPDAGDATERARKALAALETGGAAAALEALKPVKKEDGKGDDSKDS